MDFSLTTVFVVPVGNVLPSSGSTQDLSPGQFGIFRSDYTVATAGNITSRPYFYLAQGRENTYLLGSKRSDKIASNARNVIEFRKVTGCSTAANQITDVKNFKVRCGDVVTLSIRAHSSYLDTIFFNGLTRSVTVQAPCCDCGQDPCTEVDVPQLIDSLIAKLVEGPDTNHPSAINLTKFFAFERVGNNQNAILRIHGKPVDKYGNPCDPAAFPHEYDRLWFSVFVYEGPDTSADFIVSDKCKIVAETQVVQQSTFPSGTPDEVRQMEKNFHSYQAGYMKELFRLSGYNQTFESYVSDGVIYDSFYIKFNPFEADEGNWGDTVKMDSTVIVFVPNSLTSGIESILTAALGAPVSDNTCVTTTTTSSTTTTTTTV